jgi:hypothetical protein
MVKQTSNDILTPEELSLTQASKIAEMTRAGLWHNIKTNKLVARRVGHAIIIRAADLERFCKERGVRILA